MGLAMSVPQLLIILVIVALIFGTKRLKDIGGDLGGAIRSFRKSMNTADTTDDANTDAEEPKRLAVGPDQAAQHQTAENHAAQK
jgi:sec-independent protein translocase protein TatA